MSDKAVTGTLRFLGISLILIAGCVLTAQAQSPHDGPTGNERLAGQISVTGQPGRTF